MPRGQSIEPGEGDAARCGPVRTRPDYASRGASGRALPGYASCCAPERPLRVPFPLRPGRLPRNHATRTLASAARPQSRRAYGRSRSASIGQGARWSLPSLRASGARLFRGAAPAITSAAFRASRAPARRRPRPLSPWGGTPSRGHQPVPFLRAKRDGCRARQGRVASWLHRPPTLGVIRAEQVTPERVRLFVPALLFIG